MSRCKECGSFAINEHLHGRDGSDPDLCDVCYWRKRAMRGREFGESDSPDGAERREFEAWISVPPYEHMCDRNSDNSAWPGQYKRLETQLAWEAWQAARHPR